MLANFYCKKYAKAIFVAIALRFKTTCVNDQGIV